jgi:hypothetical protein
MIETALDWFQRSQATKRLQNLRQRHKKRRRLNASPEGCTEGDHDDDGHDSDNSVLAAFTIPISDPSSAGRAFLYNGTSGIAPIDVAWRRCILSALGNNSHVAISSVVPTTTSKNNNNNTPKRDDGKLFVLDGLFHNHLYSLPPPVITIEGQHDTGKTWMLTTLAARFVVATRAHQSVFDNNASSRGGIGLQGHQDGENHKVVDTASNGDERNAGQLQNIVDCDDKTRAPKHKKSQPTRQPIVIIFDSTCDLTNSQLTMLVRSSLIRHYKKHDSSYLTKDEKSESPSQQREQLKIDMDDCLSRIHVTQVDDGRGWVAVLEALRHVLRERRQKDAREHVAMNDQQQQHGGETLLQPPGTVSTPILLLWDGLLSDFKSCQSTSIHETVFGGGSSQKMSEEGSMKEVLQQMSRLLQQESHNVWLVATTPAIHSDATAPSSGCNISASHRMLLDWIKNICKAKTTTYHHPTNQDNDDHHRSRTQQQDLHRECCRVLLDRPSLQKGTEGDAIGNDGMNNSVPKSGISRASGFARVFLGQHAGTTGGNHSNTSNAKKIPYSLSLQGILS